MSVQCQNPIKININTKKTFDAQKFLGSLSHELDGHLVRYRNGLNTHIHMFAEGTAYHKATEEGIASYYKATIQ